MITPFDQRILAAIADGLPLVERPFAELAQRTELSEQEVIDRVRALVDGGVIKRFGLVVRHHELGYRANAMVVWDVPDDRVDAVGALLKAHSFVTLCYRRPRRPPDWPYNLFCMIHGCDRATVLGQMAMLRAIDGMESVPYTVLFSRQRFKQRGATYARFLEASHG